MQILDIPATHHDMSYSISMTGVTQLKEGRFKSRHGGSTILRQKPATNLPDNDSNPIQRKKVRKQKRSTLESENSRSNPISYVKPQRLYRVKKKTVRAKILGYVNQLKGEKLLYFWTITFPQSTTDDTAWLLLNKWLTRLRAEKMLREYLWVAERQDNGTVHFHMVINRKMDVQKANRFMRASIMHSINNKEVNWTREQAKIYNGVDIAKNRKTRRVINFAKKKASKALTVYLTKYISKNDTPFPHLAWHNSREYSAIVTEIRLTIKEYQQLIQPSSLNQNRQLKCDYFTFISWNGEPPNLVTKYLAAINQLLQEKINSDNSPGKRLKGKITFSRSVSNSETLRFY